jgi:hypothetical protein
MTPPASEPTPESTPEVPETAVAEPPKKEEGEVAAAVRTVLTEVLPAMAAVQNAQNAKSAKPLPASASGRCHICMQYRVACKNKHRETVLFPKNPNYGNDFPGMKLNGQVYRSDHSGHRIVVPFDSNMEFGVAEWERSEDELRMGKKRQHHSGSIGTGAAGFNPVGPDSFFR